MSDGHYIPKPYPPHLAHFASLSSLILLPSPPLLHSPACHLPHSPCPHLSARLPLPAQVELKATKVVHLGSTDPAEYPLAKKKQSMEFLREKAHLRPR